MVYTFIWLLSVGTMVLLPVVLSLASCTSLPKPTEYDSHVLASEDGSATYLAYRQSVWSSKVGIRSLHQGYKPVDLELQFQLLQYNPETVDLAWIIDVNESLHDSLSSHRELIKDFLDHSSRLIAERRLTDSYRPTIRISLVPAGSAVDHFSADRFDTQPQLHFVFPVDTASRTALVASFADSLSVIHHELVHFASAFGKLDFPGKQHRQQRINEEAFATVIELCDRLSLVNSADLDGARITFPHPAAAFSGDMEHALDTARAVGPSAIGKILAGWFFVQPIELTGEPASEEELEHLRNHCEWLSKEPQDFERLYNTDGDI